MTAANATPPPTHREPAQQEPERPTLPPDPNAAFDAIVIGSGSGGLTAAVGLSRFEKNVLMIEADRVGGDCTNVGCVPSKSLLHLSSDRDRAEDPAAVLARVRMRRDDLEAHEVVEFGGMEGINLIFGRATLQHRTAGKPGDGVEVLVTAADGSEAVYRAPEIVVATGSAPRRLPVPGLPEDRYLTNDQIFELVTAPERLVIVGAGPVGLEMATAFNRLGTAVTVLDAAPRILPSMLAEGSAVLHESMAAQGIDLRPGLVAHEFDPATNSLSIGPLGEGAASSDVLADVDAVLVAVGRVPNSGGVGLEEVGVALTGGGHVIVDDKGRTNVPGVWALGDVSVHGGTTHMANAWGRRLVQAVALPWLPLGGHPERPAVTYTKPEAATIGVQPEVVPDDVIRLTVDIAELDRSYTDEVEHGILIIDVRRLQGTILGATIVGPAAGELITVFSLAMKVGVPFHKWYGTVFPYPTYGEAIGRAIDDYISATFPDFKNQLGRWVGGRIAAARHRFTG